MTDNTNLKHGNIRDAAYRILLDAPSGMTARELCDRIRNYRGRPFYDHPSPTTLSQLLRFDSRFERMGKVKVKCMSGAIANNVVWGLK